jgi:predicted NUDIX family NTP pyrophosphohydrolase
MRKVSSVVRRPSSVLRSAGLLLYRRRAGDVEVLLVHPGGPFWRNKDLGAWSIPKGEYAQGEEPLAAATREFAEETGMRPSGHFLPLGELKQRGGKIVTAFALEGDFDPTELRCNSFELEWPPHSGKRQSFPEVDRAQWFSPREARQKILAGQSEFITRLLSALALSPG